ncbi:mycofactocin system transcriptional regulator [Nocardioides panacihumi]|uniref:Mycofactocin system transcriptional regulator n=1 Tax=Nocardioides panacihumi TaxID=400774 RepID=A0ABN2RKP1_9ACTN
MTLTSGRGRPAVTNQGEIERAAFRLFAKRGFEATTLTDIAEEVGIARRTLARYYPSKNDIPWGSFDRTIESFRATLAAMPPELPLWSAVHQGVVAFNTFPADASPSHRERMGLILHTPALQAHSVLRYAEWRAVIAAYVGTRTGQPDTALLPRLVAQVSLGLAIAAYEVWLAEPDGDLSTVLDESMSTLHDYFAGMVPSDR